MSAVEPLLDGSDVDDMLDVFAMQDAEVVRVDVTVPEQPRSGFMRKVVVPPVPARAAVNEDEIEELTDGVSEGWEEDEEDVA
jgi:hypothetical protein